jgi:hypothetical protein
VITVRFHGLFGDDVREAYQWYEAQRTGLGENLLMCLEEALGRISRQSLDRGLRNRYGVSHSGATVPLWSILSSKEKRTYRSGTAAFEAKAADAISQ